jgi:hypothetical protein
MLRNIGSECKAIGIFALNSLTSGSFYVSFHVGFQQLSPQMLEPDATSFYNSKFMIVVISHYCCTLLYNTEL